MSGLLQLDEESLYDHIFERYTLLTSNNDSLKQDLGIVDRTVSKITIDIDQFDFNNKKSNNDFYSIEINQPITSLNSSSVNNNSTTGYVVWSTTPFFTRWLIFHSNASIFRNGGSIELIDQDDELKLPPMFSNSVGLLELGSGIAGILPVTLGNFVGSFIATDQIGILSTLKTNILENLSQLNRKIVTSRSLNLNLDVDESTLLKRSLLSLECLPLDWELFDIKDTTKLDPALLSLFKEKETIYVLAMDVIYNEYLIESFLSTIQNLKSLAFKFNVNLNCLIGIQLRSEEVTTLFLEKAIIDYEMKVYYIQDNILESSRFSIYMI
uniref:Ribosomal lysine N-methyltransferase 5 n=2 Tax=Vanderwaltozyma polyspora (strain ATCC 22028 / DSM 70294 / BCRC 21397 / CBS 2163 / NBRC 10782 / NRRL Y-8283 / UCD 57-17) TaxID=436907 RepID=RKM5_VANPO|nr:RecName: Full=Ribosomal lysine N-methyltransferase 5 [Vanderwaltozyma polyspora DSM 70294]